MNDPLFDPGYMRTHSSPGHRDFYAGGIATDELPKAGPPWKLPPPVVEGQQIEYRFYDDATHDRIAQAVAVLFNGALTWTPLRLTGVPGRVVGTAGYVDFLGKTHLDAYVNELMRHQVQMREHWAECRLKYYLGEDLTPANFKGELPRPAAVRRQQGGERIYGAGRHRCVSYGR